MTSVRLVEEPVLKTVWAGTPLGFESLTRRLGLMSPQCHNHHVVMPIVKEAYHFVSLVVKNLRANWVVNRQNK